MTVSEFEKTRHPCANLDLEEVRALDMLVVALGGGPASYEDWLDAAEVARQTFHHGLLLELVAGGYVQRSSETPPLYRATNAGFDAAIQYGCLEIAE